MKRIVMYGLLFCWLVMLSACAGVNEVKDTSNSSQVTKGNVESGSDSNLANQSEVEQDSNEPAELVFWSSSRMDPAAFDENIGDPVREQFPNYTIEYIQRVPDQTDLSQLFATGQRVDIIFESYGSFTNSVIRNELQYDMSDLAAKHDVDLDRFESSMIESMINLGDGKLYGLPVSTGIYGLYYNKDLFDKFGVAYPTDGMTWDELNELAVKLNRMEGGQFYAGFAPSANHMILLNPFSVPLIDKETNRSTYHDDRWKTIIETELLQHSNSDIYRQLLTDERNGRLMNHQQFVDGKVAMVIRANGAPNYDFDWDIVSMPHYASMPNVGYQAYPQYYAITNTAVHKDAAMEVLKFLTSDEYQIKQNKKGSMTVLKDRDIQQTYMQETEYTDKNWGAFFYNELAPGSDKTVIEDLIEKRAYGSLVDRLGDVVMGTMDLNTALREAEEEVNMGIDQYLGQ